MRSTVKIRELRCHTKWYSVPTKFPLLYSFSIWHPACTCAVGSCIDENFIVKGTTNLRVIDMSSLVSPLPKVSNNDCWLFFFSVAVYYRRSPNGRASKNLLCCKFSMSEIINSQPNQVRHCWESVRYHQGQQRRLNLNRWACLEFPGSVKFRSSPFLLPLVFIL